MVAGRSTRSLAIIMRATLFRTVFGALAMVFVSTAESAFPGIDHWARWSVDDEAGQLSIQLRADGKCSYISRDPKTHVLDRRPCSYWIHGGRVRLRGFGEKMGAGLNALEIEHLRESDTLTILGNPPRTLRRVEPEI